MSDSMDDCYEGFDITQKVGYSLAEGAPKVPTRKDWERLLLDQAISIEDACHIKWRWGIEEHRGGDETKPFNGDELAEIHCEGLDCLNYLPMLMEKYGDNPVIHECLEEMRVAAEKLVRGARAVHAILVAEWLRRGE